MSLPLEGLRVLDLTRLLPGGFCSLLLADFGAEVIKVEDTGLGDYIRWSPPFYEGAEDTAKGALFLALNRGKRSIRIDLKNERGREALLALVREYDVVLESFRPGVLDRLGGIEERDIEVPRGAGRDQKKFADFYAEYFPTQKLPKRGTVVCVGPLTYKGHAALQKDITTFKAALKGTDVADAERRLLLAFPTLRGGREILDTAASGLRGDRPTRALHELAQLWDLRPRFSIAAFNALAANWTAAGWLPKSGCSPLLICRNSPLS